MTVVSKLRKNWNRFHDSEQVWWSLLSLFESTGMKTYDGVVAHAMHVLFHIRTLDESVTSLTPCITSSSLLEMMHVSTARV